MSALTSTTYAEYLETLQKQIAALQTELAARETGHVVSLKCLRESQVSAKAAVEAAISHLQSQLRASYERISVVEAEVVTLQGRIKVLEDLRIAEKAAVDERILALESQLVEVKAAKAAGDLRMKAVGERLKAAVDALPFLKVARSSHGGYAATFVDLSVKLNQLLVEVYGYPSNTNVEKMDKNTCAVM